MPPRFASSIHRLLVFIAALPAAAFLLSPSPSNAQAAFVQSRATEVTFDVFAGATSQIDRLRVLDSFDSVIEYTFDQEYFALDVSLQGAGQATGDLLIFEDFELSGGVLIITSERTSFADGQSLSGEGIGFSALNNSFNVVFDVLGPLDFQLTTRLENDPLGVYSGRVVLDDVQLSVPPIFDEDMTSGPAILAGTLATGTYRLRTTMNGALAVSEIDPGPKSAIGNYDVTLELFVPEPGGHHVLGLAGLWLFALSSSRNRSLHGASPHR